MTQQTDPTRHVVYLTGTRADFGLMRSTLDRIAASPGIRLSLAVTGMHLSDLHGRTVDEVRAAGFRIAGEIPLDMQTRSGASMAMGIADCLRGMTALLEVERPDLLLVLGDRGEMLAGAIAALHVGIPCVHMHGGERSGTVDEPVRHAISKLAAFHFVATADSRDRLVRMGEEPDRIFVVGAPGLDGIADAATADRPAALRALGMPDGFVLVLFHPVVQQAASAAQQALALQLALGRVGRPVLWLDPNADAGSRAIVDSFDPALWPPGSRRVTHLQRGDFLSAMRHASAMVGNSSSGIIEAASFGTPVVNVGDRQKLRLHGPNVVDLPASADAIEQGLLGQLNHGRWPCENPWGDGHAGERIAALLPQLPLGAAVLEKFNRD